VPHYRLPGCMDKRIKVEPGRNNSASVMYVPEA
jgi:hypothetical protein